MSYSFKLGIIEQHRNTYYTVVEWIEAIAYPYFDANHLVLPPE